MCKTYLRIAKDNFKQVFGPVFMLPIRYFFFETFGRMQFGKSQTFILHMAKRANHQWFQFLDLSLVNLINQTLTVFVKHQNKSHCLRNLCSIKYIDVLKCWDCIIRISSGVSQRIVIGQVKIVDNPSNNMYLTIEIQSWQRFFYWNFYQQLLIKVNDIQFVKTLQNAWLIYSGSCIFISSDER